MTGKTPLNFYASNVPGGQGAYDWSGTFFGPGTEAITSFDVEAAAPDDEITGALPDEVEFDAYDVSSLSYQQIAALEVGDLKINVNFETKTTDPFDTHDLYIQAETLADSTGTVLNDTDTTGPGSTQSEQYNLLTGGNIGDYYQLVATIPVKASFGPASPAVNNGAFWTYDVTQAVLAANREGDPLFISSAEKTGGVSEVNDVYLSGSGTALGIPTLLGLTPTGSMNDTDSYTPFATATLWDDAPSPEDVATITLLGPGSNGGKTASDAVGTLTGPGVTKIGVGTYQISGNPKDVAVDLQQLKFQAAPTETNAAYTEYFQLDVQGTQGSSSYESQVFVVGTDAPPVIAGAAPVSGTDQEPYAIFKALTVTESTSAYNNLSATLTLTGGKGALSGTGLISQGGGLYSLAATTASALQAELKTIAFTPQPGTEPVGSSITSQVDLKVAQTATGYSSEALETLTTVAAAATPQVSGVTSATGPDRAPYKPYSTAVVSIAEQNPALTAVIVENYPGAGALSGSGLVSLGDGVYGLDVGAPVSAAALTTQLRALEFTPVEGLASVGETIVSKLNLKVQDASGGLAGSADELLTTTAAHDAPSISSLSERTFTEGAPINPFSGVTLVDPTRGATETFKIQLSEDHAGLTAPDLVSLGSGLYEIVGSVTHVNSDLAQAQYLRPVGANDSPDLVTLSDTSTWNGDVLTAPDAYFGILDKNNSDVNNLGGAPCYSSGTHLAAFDGQSRMERAVEALAVGDRVVLASGEIRSILWIGRREIELRRHPRPELVRPVRIAAGALGENLPVRDLIVSPEHALWLEDRWVPARDLINGATIRQEAWSRVTYYHVELDAHEILLAEGVPAESYLDCGNRSGFDNSGVVAIHPDWSQQAASRTFASPALTARLRARFAARAVDLHRGAEVRAHEARQRALAQARRTNFVRNPRAEGAVVGEIGAEGRAPHFWWLDAPRGVAIAIVAVGEEDGLPYLDVRFAGRTPTGGPASVHFQPGCAALAGPGEDWTVSCHLRLIGGDFGSIESVCLFVDEYDAHGAYLTGAPYRQNWPTADDLALQRVSVTRRLMRADVASTTGYVQISMAADACVDVTLRIAGAQIEQGAYASDLILPPAGRLQAMTREEGPNSLQALPCASVV